MPEHIKILTVHDSILLFGANAEDVELVRNIILKKAEEVYGFKIPLKTEEMNNIKKMRA